MIRRLPLIPTIIVAAAAAVMVWLGIWQLGRADEKMQLITMYSKSTALAQEAVFPQSGPGDDVWFRRSSIQCEEVVSLEAVAGTSQTGQKGWAQRARCNAGAEVLALVDIGFTRDLSDVEWDGGPVTGVIAPGPRLVADPPQAGLEPLAKPNPSDLPNNHLAYAGQWFFFAITALIMYWFAVRSRLAKRD
jgi:surfeit locus 1 family protein